MNREQKAAAITEIAEQIKESEAIFAVDYRGITVAEVADLRSRLRESDASFRVVKNTLTERAADDADAALLKDHLEGPTALMFCRGDAAAAAKAIADFQKASGGDLLPWKGGMMNGAALDAAQIAAISKLPSRDVLMGQLVGVIASPITGLARGMNGMLSGLAVALGGVLEGKQNGTIPAGDAPAATESAPAASETEEPAAEADAPASDEAPASEDADNDTNTEGSDENND